VHYAVYQFPGMARLDAALKSEGFKDLVADFDRAWPAGVVRTRDMLNLVEEAPRLQRRCAALLCDYPGRSTAVPGNYPRRADLAEDCQKC